MSKTTKTTKKTSKKTTKKDTKATKVTKIVKATKTTKAKSNEKEKCVWNLGTRCKGTIKKVPIFDKQILVPICATHLEEHRTIMILHHNGYDIEEVLNQKPNERRQEALTLELAGISVKDIEL